MLPMASPGDYPPIMTRPSCRLILAAVSTATARMRSVRKLLILAKIEATYGTDVLPAGADAILVTNASLKPLEAELIDRDFVRSYLGASGKIMAGEYAKLEF
jgi:hypothetical protein